MRNKYFTGFRLAACLCYVFTISTILNCTSPQDKAQLNDGVTGKQELDSLVNIMMKEAGIPGASVAIIKNNEVAMYNVYGEIMGDKTGIDIGYFPWAVIPDSSYTGRPVTDQTIFNGASLSKLLLLPVAYQLMDEGKLDMDKPLYEYFEYEPLSEDERYREITARMVLSHTSGIENWVFMNDPSNLEIIEEPGSSFVYSGEGYVFLVKVIEEIVGANYEDYIKNRILKPLNLHNTYLTYSGSNEDTIYNNAIAHKLDGGQYFIRNERPEPGYGNHFTAHDFAKIMVSLLDGSTISDKAKQTMLSPVMEISGSGIFTSPGFYVNVTENDTLIGFDGDNPGYKNFFLYSVKKGNGLVLLTNNDLGKSMFFQLATSVAQVNAAPFLHPSFNYSHNLQFPDKALSLLNMYSKEGYDKLKVTVDNLSAEELDHNTLNKVGYFINAFSEKEKAVAILEVNRNLFPQSALTYALLGEYNMNLENYDAAKRYLDTADSLGFDMWDIAEMNTEVTPAIQNN